MRTFFGRLLESWVRAVLRHRITVIAATLALTAVSLYYALSHFSINVDMSGMISRDLPFQRLQHEFSNDFPVLNNNLVVVIDAGTAEGALSARDRLARVFRREKTLFKSVYVPGGGRFFEKNGLLYMSVGKLEGFGDRLAEAQPMIALLSKDMSLGGLFSALQMILEHPGASGTRNVRIAALFDDMSKAFSGVAEGRPSRLSWLKIMFGEKEASAMKRQYIILQPYLETSSLSSGEGALSAVKTSAEELGMKGVRVRITGDVALNYENMQAVEDSVGPETLVSLLLVAFLLYIGLGRSLRLIVASLATLLVGLIWTTGFAIAFIGSLNMISVTFAVLYVGLGIDYSIQVCLRYRELRTEGRYPGDAIAEGATNVGMSLFLSCVTTAFGFYSFIPTAYVGVAELGLIAGTGMLISFFANLTVLPALLGVLSRGKDMGERGRHGVPLVKSLPYAHPRGVVIAAFIIGAGAAFLLPRVTFDYNPLDLYNQHSESVKTIKGLFGNTESPPWTISVLVRGGKEAREMAGKLAVLKKVKRAITIFDFVPSDQKEKLDIISGISLFIPPGLGRSALKHPSYEEDVRALKNFERALSKPPPGPLEKPALRLYHSVRDFESLLGNPGRGRRALAELEEDMLANLPVLFRRLDTSLQASYVNMTNLPADLVSQYVGLDGRYRVQVFPSGNLMKRAVLAGFVHDVREVAPGATDSPVSIYESGIAVSSSFRNATLYALAAIVFFLLLELRSLSATFYILIPLFFAMVLTGAASVLLNIPLNFANVVVVPLMLGSGVHAGILFVLRFMEKGGASRDMLTTSTARSILFSSLTTMASTGSLAFSSHRGIASIGVLLTLCFGFLTLSTLILLPAMLGLLSSRWGRAGRKPFAKKS